MDKHFVAYHIAADRGRLDWTEKSTMSFETAKWAAAQSSLHQWVWVVQGEGSKKHRQHLLLGAYKPEKIRKGTEGGRQIVIVRGPIRKRFQQPIVLNGQSWFKRLYQSQRNFSFGLNEIKEPGVLAQLEKYLEKATPADWVRAAYSLIHPDKAAREIFGGGQGTLDEGRPWTTVAKWHAECPKNQPLWLLLGDSSYVRGVEWIAVIDDVTITNKKRTEVAYSRLHRLSKPIPLKQLIKASNREPLASHYQRPYVPVLLSSKVVDRLAGSNLNQVVLPIDRTPMNKGSLIRAETEREATVLTRLGQDQFRKALMQVWSGKCALTGSDVEEVLVASHIRPWKKSSPANRLNPFNGLLLAAHVDRLFDKGLISFDDHGCLLMGPRLQSIDLIKLGIKPEARLRHLCDEHRKFLRWHRKVNGFP